MKRQGSESTVSARSISWICFVFAMLLVAFWLVYFPIERVQLRALAESINADMPASAVFFLGGVSWKIPAIAAVAAMFCVVVQFLLQGRMLSIAGHLTAILVLGIGIVVYRDGMYGWFVQLISNV